MIGDSRLVFIEIFENSLKLNIFARDTRKTKSYQRAQLNPSSAIAQLGLGIASGLMHGVSLQKKNGRFWIRICTGIP